MFENKAGEQSTSPPSRDRSPNPSEVSGSSRAASKVRASFVAVERPGDLGQPPQFGLKQVHEDAMGDNNETTIESQVATGSSAGEDRTQNEPQSPHVATQPIDGGLGTILKGSSFESATQSKKATEAKNLAHTLNSSQVQKKGSRTPAAATNGSKAASMVEKMQNNDKSTPPTTTRLQTTKAAQPVKPPPTRRVETKSAPRSPTVTKQSPTTPKSPARTPTKPSGQTVGPSIIRGGPEKIKAVMESANRAKETRASITKEKESTVAQSGKRAGTAAEKSKANGVKKDEPQYPKSTRRPKSPTRPAKLPSAATASTAASAARTETGHATDGTSTTKPTDKKAPTTRQAPRVASTETASSLAKKASRASLTSNNPTDRPKSRVSSTKAADQGFLSRMMRPTTSSAQKLHDKVQPTSPPRSRNVPAGKAKDLTKKPSRMSLTKAPVPEEESKPMDDGIKENKENKDNTDVENVKLPELGAVSPLAAVKEDPMSNTEHAKDAEPGDPLIQQEASSAKGAEEPAEPVAGQQSVEIEG